MGPFRLRILCVSMESPVSPKQSTAFFLRSPLGLPVSLCAVSGLPQGFFALWQGTTLIFYLPSVYCFLSLLFFFLIFYEFWGIFWDSYLLLFLLKEPNSSCYSVGLLCALWNLRAQTLENSRNKDNSIIWEQSFSKCA